MTTPPDWHAPTAVLVQFARDPVSVDDVTAASVEAHLLACDRCRAAVAGAVPQPRRDASWSAVADAIDRPRTSVLERALLAIGVRSGTARLAAATPGLRASGVAAVAGLTAIAVAAARYVDGGGPFLVAAPLVPLAAVALTFSPVADPGGEAGVATPVHGTALALRRAVAVCAVAFAVLAVGALAVPSLGSAPLGWVLPAAALATGSLALATWVRVELAVGGLATIWVVAIGIVRVIDKAEGPLSDGAPFTTAGQLTTLLLAAIAAVILARRADRYATLEA